MGECKSYLKPEVVRILTMALAPFCASSYEFSGDTGTEDVDIFGPEL